MLVHTLFVTIRQMVSKKRYYELKTAGLCVKCGSPRENSESNVKCQLCHDKFKAQRNRKNKTKKVKDIDTYDSSQVCQVCKTVIEEFDIGCRRCQAAVSFTQKDALNKLDAACVCGKSQIDRLCIASADPYKPMKLHGGHLYRAICQSLKPLPGYRVICNSCYWAESVGYTKQARLLFEQQGDINLHVDTESDADIIDIEHETT